jgi:hypothetical protein
MEGGRVMTERSVSDEFWGDPFVEELPSDAKLLYLWLMTNKRQNPSGIFESTIRAIATETGLDTEDVPGLIGSLSEKVVWCREKNLIWVKNFTRRQCKSSRFLLGAIPSLRALKNGDIKEAYIAYNKEIFDRYNIDIVFILYGYDRDTSDLTCTDLFTNTITSTDGVFSFASFLFTLYEEHFGRSPTTDMPDLIEAARTYPEDTIRAAFDEMKEKANKPCWKYVKSILATQPKQRTTTLKGRKALPVESPDEYERRYGHMLKKKVA